MNITKDVSIIKKERIKYLNNHKTDFPLILGEYSNDGESYRFILNKDSSYALYYKTLILSAGTYYRFRNELVLFDSSIKFYFYVLIADKYLISKLLPSDYLGCILTKK